MTALPTLHQGVNLAMTILTLLAVQLERTERICSKTDEEAESCCFTGQVEAIRLQPGLCNVNGHAS